VSRLTNIDYDVQIVARDRTDDGSGELSMGANSEKITYLVQDNILMATKIYTDIVDNPSIKITVYEQREILEQGHKALRVAVILMAVGVTSALALLLLMLQKSVIAPVNLLTRDILARRQSKQAWEPLRMGGCASQEICLFTDEFNQLMGSLDSKNTQLAEVNFSLMGEAKKLKEAQGILKNLDQLKSEFISTAAHELRTPVASIMGFTDLLSDPETIASFSEVQKQDFLQEIYDSCERLSKNVDDILDVSRIEAGSSIPLDKQSISTEILLSKTVNHFKLKAKHQITLELKSSTPENMVVDVHRISQIMENLLSNAIKYSPKRSRISIVAERDGRYCKVTVIDQGVGMTEEQVARVFDKFYRVDSSDTAVRGLGLGMSIVKQIIEDHGGTIWVDSLLGEGSSVYFTLPIAGLEEGN
ncbi:MAG: HAMP domain-containing histidine kinase, partial [Desulfuromonadales bacterium]|nr:HAMP domain-containing histidine kinase [Desulfuromonadales bacterium]